MDHPELLRRLNKLAKAITTHIKYVNYGGCCNVASLVGAALRNAGIMVEVVTPCDRNKPAALVRLNVARPRDPLDWDNNGLSRSHLAVRFRSGGRTYTWDSDGLVRSASRFGKDPEYETSTKFGDGLSVDEAAAMCATAKGWNSRFDRKQLPLLKHLVRHYLVYGL